MPTSFITPSSSLGTDKADGNTMSGAETGDSTNYLRSAADNQSLVSNKGGDDSLPETEGGEDQVGPGNLQRRTAWMDPVQGKAGDDVAAGYEEHVDQSVDPLERALDPKFIGKDLPEKRE